MSELPKEWPSSVWVGYDEDEHFPWYVATLHRKLLVEEAKEYILREPHEAEVARLKAENERSLEDVTHYAGRLAEYLRWRFHPNARRLEPLPDLLGVLTRIDNMIATIPPTP